MFENRSEQKRDAQGADDPKTTCLRNQLVAWCKHIATETVKARALGNRSALVDSFIVEALEAASTSGENDVRRLARLNLKADLIFQLSEYLAGEEKPEYQKDVEKQILDQEKQGEEPDDATVDELFEQGKEYAEETLLARLGATVFGLRQTVRDALRGVAADARRALELGKKAVPKKEFEVKGLRARIKEIRARDVKEKETKAKLIAEADALEETTNDWKKKERALIDGLIDVLAFLATEPTEVDALVDAALNAGKLEAIALDVLERGVFFEFGTPIPAVVRASAAPGQCVLFSGDDFDVLLELLKQAEFRELNVWTRGEASAAHSFPAFKKYRRLVGHYGGSWSDQAKEFDAFPGAIVVAASPLQEPGESYRDYLFAVDSASRFGVARIEKNADGKYDFSDVVRAATDSSGFFKAKTNEKIAVGFGGEALDGMIDKTTRAFRQDRLKKVFVVGGEDVDGPAGEYFAELFDAIPQESLIIAFGDVKFRFARKQSTPTEYGTPRSIDVGRSRDANAALRFAAKFGAELDRVPATTPIAFFLSLFNEKSLADVLAVLALGYRDVFVGPTAPRYWNAEIIGLFAEKTGLKIVDAPEKDVADALA